MSLHNIIYNYDSLPRLVVSHPQQVPGRFSKSQDLKNSKFNCKVAWEPGTGPRPSLKYYRPAHGQYMHVNCNYVHGITLEINYLYYT